VLQRVEPLVLVLRGDVVQLLVHHVPVDLTGDQAGHGSWAGAWRRAAAGAGRDVRPKKRHGGCVAALTALREPGAAARTSDDCSDQLIVALVALVIMHMGGSWGCADDMIMVCLQKRFMLSQLISANSPASEERVH